MFIKTIFLVGLLSLNTQHILSQTKYTLSDIYKMTIEKNNRVKITELNRDIADIRLEEAYALRMPSVTLNSGYAHIGEITSFNIPISNGTDTEIRKFMFGNPNLINADIQFRMPIYASGRIKGNIDIAERQRKISGIRLSHDKILLTDMVLRQFFTLILYREMVRLDEGNLEWAENHLKTAEERFSTGHAPEMDVLSARVQLSNARNILEESRNNYTRSKLSLANLAGLEDEDFRLVGNLSFETTQFLEEKLIEHALSFRSDLRSNRFKKEILQHQVQIQSKSGMPNLEFFAGYSITNGFDPMQPDKFVDNWNMGFQFVFPVFEPFPASSKAQIAAYQLSIAKYEQKELEKQITLEVKQGVMALRQAESRIRAQEENLNLTREAMSVAEAQYENGLISSLELMEARKAVYKSELLYLQALYNHIMARIEICRIIEDYSWFAGYLQ